MNRRNFLGAVGTTALVISAAAPSTAEEMMVQSGGMFEGRSNHVTSGSVKIVKDGGRLFVELGEDFSLDSGPDPRVGFGRGGEYLGAEGYLGALLSLKGKQRYAIPPVWDSSSYDQVFIWCDVANVPLGVADLKKM